MSFQLSVYTFLTIYLSTDGEYEHLFILTKKKQLLLFIIQYSENQKIVEEELTQK